jgi:hypothetical protein
MKIYNVKAWALCVSMLGAVLPMSLAAGESHDAIPLPALQSDPAGTVDPQDCTVSIAAGEVTVAVTAKPSGDAPALLLDGVPFGWTGDAAPYSERQFPELEVRIDGVSAALEDRFETFVGRTNITNFIKLAQMDPWAITHTPPLTTAHPPTPQVLNGLKNLGAIVKPDDLVKPDYLGTAYDIVNSDDRYLAKWTSRRVLRIPLKPVVEQKVEFHYTARPATQSLTVAQLDTRTRERAYCLSAAQLKRVLHGAAAATLLSAEEFTIPVAIDGKLPQAVSLSVLPDAAGPSGRTAQVFFCAARGKPVAKAGAFRAERAEVDDAGNLHLLRVASPP